MKRLRSTFTLVSLVMSFALVCTLLPAKAWASTAVPSSFTSSSTSITGTIDLSAYTTSSGQEVTRDEKTYYEGNVGGSVEAGDLFAGAYQKYESTFAGKKDLRGKKYENIVMFSKGQKFPVATYKVTFPSNFVVDSSAISATENTNTISKIVPDYDPATNSVTFTMYLGNWNDYKGFFDLYTAEQGTTGHAISINIPYSVEVTNTSTQNLGTITASGECALYKYGFLAFGTRMVNVTTTPLTFVVTR